MYWHCPCKVWHPSNQKCTFSSNFKTFKHLGPSLCFKQLFHLNVKWSKCEHIESINRGKASRALNPCLCSIVIYITCHQQITTSRNPAIEESKRYLLSFPSCPWTWSWTQQHTTKQLPGERQVSPSSICSPHMAKASMQASKKPKEGGYSHDMPRPISLQHSTLSSSLPSESSRAMVSHLDGETNFDGLSGAPNLTSHAEVRAYATAPAVFHFIYFMYHGCQVQYFGKGWKRILDDHSIARCTQVWRNKNAATGKAAFMAFKDSVLHVLSCVDVF